MLFDEANLLCEASKAGTGVNVGEISKSKVDFCKVNAGQSTSTGINLSGKYKMLLGDSYAAFSIVWDDSNGCPTDGSYAVDEDVCNRLFSRTINDCDTDFTQPYGKHGGTISYHCAVFKLQTSYAELVTCPSNPTEFIPPHDLNVIDATAAVEDYCGQNLDVDPSTGRGAFSIYDKNLAYKVRTNTFFDSWTTGCGNNVKFQASGPECVRKMTAVINKCKVLSPSWNTY